MGEPQEVKPGWGGFHENPAACICEAAGRKTKTTSVPKKPGNGSLQIKKGDTDAAVEDKKVKEQVWFDHEEEDDPKLFELLSD